MDAETILSELKDKIGLEGRIIALKRIQELPGGVAAYGDKNNICYMMGVCRMLLPVAFIEKEPIYTVSDRAWRRAMQLSKDHLTLATPPDKLGVMLENLAASRQ